MNSAWRTQQKVSSVERTVHSDLDEARKALRLNLIETDLKLNEAEEEEFRPIIREEEMGELRQMRLKFGDLPENVLGKIQVIEDEEER